MKLDGSEEDRLDPFGLYETGEQDLYSQLLHVLTRYNPAPNTSIRVLSHLLGYVAAVADMTESGMSMRQTMATFATGFKDGKDSRKRILM